MLGSVICHSSAYSFLGTFLARTRRLTGAALVMYNTPLGQTAMPLNPDCISGSHASRSLTDSKPEPYINKFVMEFHESAFITDSEWVQQLEWPDTRAKFHLSSQ